MASKKFSVPSSNIIPNAIVIKARPRKTHHHLIKHHPSSLPSFHTGNHTADFYHTRTWNMKSKAILFYHLDLLQTWTWNWGVWSSHSMSWPFRTGSSKTIYTRKWIHWIEAFTVPDILPLVPMIHWDKYDYVNLPRK